MSLMMNDCEFFVTTTSL